MSINEDQYKVLQEKIDQLQKSADITNRDLTKDRRDLQEFTIRLGAVENQLAELRKGQNNMADKVGDQLLQAVEPLLESTQDLKESIDKKRFVRFNNEIKGFWKRMWDKIRIKR